MSGGPSIVFTREAVVSALRIWSILFTRKQDQKVKLRVFISGKQKQIECFNVDSYCDHCKTVFEAIGCYYHFCFCQEARPALTDQDFERGNKKREMDDLRREYKKGKGYKVEEMWECEWWESFKTNDKIKKHFRTYFPYISQQKTFFYRLLSSKNKRWISFWLCSMQLSCSR